MPCCNKTIFVAVLAIWTATVAIGRAADDKASSPGLAALQPDLRSRLDALALKSPRPGRHAASLDFSGNIVAWLISHTVISPQEEFQAATRNHEALLRQYRAAPTPPIAAQAFEKLLAAMPPHLKPAPFTYRLTVLESEELDAMTVGGGYVYVTRPLVEGLLSDAERGPAALALLLAGELGRIGLEQCRRGYQLALLEEDAKAGRPLPVDEGLLRRAWETGFVREGSCLRFLYLRDEIYEADMFALHLCRNAQFDLDAALDGLRWPMWLADRDLQPPQPVAEEEGQPEKPLEDYLRSPPELAQRLKQLLLERDGRTDDEASFGLFAVDVASGKLTKAEPQQGQQQASLVFVHGFAGKEASFENFFRSLNDRTEAKTRRVLFFRYPNNGSLSAAGEMLAREMKRVVAAPEQAVFICHSAGGLAFRFYAEKRQGRFDRAIFLGTPHGGTGLTQLKFVVDAGTFFRDLKLGLPDAIQRAINEGTRQVKHDLHPDSLFLRYLGYDETLAPRYEIYCGRVFKALESFGLAAAVDVTRGLLARQAVERIQHPRLKVQLGSLVERLRLPVEIADGDLIVSVESANLPNAADFEITRLNHVQLNSDPDLVDEVLDRVLGEPEETR